jgi:hypothetical protein
MSIDRWYLPRIRLTSILAFGLLVAVSAQADDTWHNVYHSLKRFFTGKPSSTPVVHHHRRRSQDEEKSEPSPAPAENVPSPGASATPRVVVLPATSPTTETTPGTENPAKEPEAAAKPGPSPEAAVKPSPSPELGPVLRSLSGPTPVSGPGVIPSPAPGVIPTPASGAGNTATN